MRSSTTGGNGNVPPQAYIVQIDGTARHYECESDGFMGEAFAECVEKRIHQERGVAVLSIAELWMVDNWDGVRPISEHADRYDVLAATVEMVNNPTLLYAWPIERDNGVGHPSRETRRLGDMVNYADLTRLGHMTRARTTQFINLV